MSRDIFSYRDCQGWGPVILAAGGSEPGMPLKHPCSTKDSPRTPTEDSLTPNTSGAQAEKFELEEF